MKKNSNKNTILESVKFWAFSKLGLPYIRVLVINKSRIIGIKDYSINQVDPVTIFNHIFKLKLENTIMEKNISLLFFDLNNSEPLEIDETGLKIYLGKGSTNKDLSTNIDQRVVNKLFSVTPMMEILPILLSTACMGGIIYIILILHSIIQ